jgi:lipopolysaccharide/colanic/teichoic acid biosynthesis glycosyltransferase
VYYSSAIVLYITVAVVLNVRLTKMEKKMKNKLTVLLSTFLLVATPFVVAAENAKVDTDSDGKISYEEYRASKEKAHERQFKRMDTNGDGYIDASEKQAQKDKMRAMRKKRKQNAG